MTSVRRIVADLKAALDADGIKAMAEAHSAGMKSSFSYRLFCGLINLVYPATSLLDLMKDVDRRIGELGMIDGSKAVLSTLPTSWRPEFPEGREREIKTRPVVVFGRHGSILTPFLITASLDRPDLKMLAASYVGKLGPNVARCMYPVHLPIPTFRRAARKGILLRIGAWLTARLNAAVEKDVAREQNRASLIRAADHVLGGGALLIAPNAHNPKAKWRTGIGLLVARLAENPAATGDTCLVPYRIWASITGIFHLLSRNPLMRAFGRWEYRRPIRVVFGEPIPLSEVLDRAGLDPARITEFLEARYHGLGF